MDCWHGFFHRGHWIKSFHGNHWVEFVMSGFKQPVKAVAQGRVHDVPATRPRNDLCAGITGCPQRTGSCCTSAT